MCAGACLLGTCASVQCQGESVRDSEKCACVGDYSHNPDKNTTLVLAAGGGSYFVVWWFILQHTTLALATGGGSYFKGTATPRLSSRRGVSTRGT